MTRPAHAGWPVLVLFLLLIVGWAGAAEDDKLTVIIEGLDERLRDNVAIHLQINQLVGKPLPSESRLRWLHKQADGDIRRALEPFGYYQPRIDSSLEKTASGWRARYRIQSGPPLRVAKMDVQVLGEGARDPAFQKILHDLPLAPGQILEHSRYERIKDDFQELATERGYFDARLPVHEIRVDLQAYRAEVVLHFDTGQRYRYGQITFHQDALAPEFLRRYLDIHPGDPYLASDLLKLQSDLLNSDYFSRVEVNTQANKAADYTLPVDVDLQPQKSHKYTFGLGYGTDTGPRGRFKLERPWINPWGHHYEVELLASQIKIGLGAKYLIPGKDPRHDSFSLQANVLGEKSDTKDYLTETIGVSQQHKDDHWVRINSLQYQRETFTISGDQQTTGLLIPDLNWTYVLADNRLHTDNGLRVNLELRGSYEPLLSDISFLQGILRGKFIKSLGDVGRLILRGDIGSTWTSDFDRLPTSLRFYAGGDNSVRGYSLDSIGPRDAEGDVVGGKNLVVGSLEYDHRLFDGWSIAGFVDSGDAFDTSKPDLKTGVGFGVRWQSPVGPVRVDLASGLQYPGDTIRLHLSIGPDL